MATLKSAFPTWTHMWSGYRQNYLDIIGETFTKTLGSRTIHMLVLNSVYNYWKNDEFENDEESSIDKIMTLIRAKSVRLAQNQLLYKNIYEGLKIPKDSYQELKEIITADLAPFYRKNTYSSANIVKSGNIQHHGLAYGSQNSERISKPQQTTTLSSGQNRQKNQTTLKKQYLIDKNWIPRLLNSFAQAGINLTEIVQEFHPFFCKIYPFEEGKFFWDEEVKDYKWKSKRSEEEIEIDPKTGKPLDDESLRDISKDEYDQWKEDKKEGLKPTWYLEGTYRFLGRLQKELTKKSAQSKQKQEERIEACEKLIKIYEKTYERPTIDYFFKTLNDEIEGYEEYKNIVGNYFVNLLNPTSVQFRPLSFILVGPPGTGKSAIAKATAKASKRAFISIPMNGVDEPTYLKGREIAYGGADQGKLLKEMLNKGSSQPIVLIDELTRAKGKAITDIIGTMTDPDQNAYSFEDDWLKWKLDLSQCVFIIADNHIEKFDPFLISRSSVVNIPILTYQKRIALVKKVANKVLSNENETKAYVNKITDDFCKYMITEEWGVRQSLANINNLFLGLRAYVLMKNPIIDFNNPKTVDKSDTSFVLTYQKGQKITLVRCKSEGKGLDGIIHSVFTDVADWPGAKLHDEKKEKAKITILDLAFQGLYTFDFTRYPEVKSIDISNNDFSDLDLSSNPKLKFLNLFSNSSLDSIDINFGESKKSLEEINFALAEEKQTINLRGFDKLKKITYDWKVAVVYLDESLRNKVKLDYTKWENLDEEAKIEFQSEYPDSEYDVVMKGKVIFE